LARVEREELKELLRADADPAREQALEMERRQAGGGRDVVELRLLLGMRGDIGERLLDAGIVAGHGLNSVVSRGNLGVPGAAADPELAPVRA
jgi:hypothetical protein